MVRAGASTCFEVNSHGLSPSKPKMSAKVNHDDVSTTNLQRLLLDLERNHQGECIQRQRIQPVHARGLGWDTSPFRVQSFVRSPLSRAQAQKVSYGCFSYFGYSSLRCMQPVGDQSMETGEL